MRDQSMLSRRYVSIAGCILVVAILFFSGCAGASTARLVREQAEKYNKWVGVPKEDRIRVQGIPTACFTLSDAGEDCEWRTTGSCGSGSGDTYTTRPCEDLVIFTYGSDHIAKSWSYVGRFGNFTSSDHPAAQNPQLETSIYVAIMCSGYICV